MDTNTQTKEQYELFEKARQRTKEKKRLIIHAVFFLIGSVFFIILNKVMKFQEQLDWYVWAIFGWLFFLTIHFFNVFVTNRFFGKKWLQAETEKLVLKHQKKVEKLEQKLEKDGTFLSNEERENDSLNS